MLLLTSASLRAAVLPDECTAPGGQQKIAMTPCLLASLVKALHDNPEKFYRPAELPADAWVIEYDSKDPAYREFQELVAAKVK